ncbi:MAG: DHHA1 domain-containing protein, partial [Candidatus Thorarchaeota archaeon]
FSTRDEAEQKYGMTIYQGGAIPGKNLRIVEVPGVDVEACGGTHLNNTSETGYIHITKSQKIQDGIVRLTFVAGEATNKLREKHKKILNELKDILYVDRKHLVGRVKELLEKWKNVNKSLKTGTVDENDLQLISSETFEGDVLSEISQVLNIRKADVSNKIQKLYNEWMEGKQKLSKIKDLFNDEAIEKRIQTAQLYHNTKLIFESTEDLTQDDVKNLSQNILKKDPHTITFISNQNEKGIMFMGMSGSKSSIESDINIGNIVSAIKKQYNGKGGGRNDFGQVFITKKGVTSEDVLEFIKDNYIKGIDE